MSVTVHLPGVLRAHAGGAADVPVELPPAPGGAASSLRAVLDVLGRDHPGLVRRIMDERGALRRFVNVYVDDVDVRQQDGLATPVPDGATVLVLPSVAGGAHGRRHGPGPSIGRRGWTGTNPAGQGAADVVVGHLRRPAG